MTPSFATCIKCLSIHAHCTYNIKKFMRGPKIFQEVLVKLLKNKKCAERMDRLGRRTQKARGNRERGKKEIQKEKGANLTRVGRSHKARK